MKTIILGVEYHIVPDPDRNCRSSVICRFHGARSKDRDIDCTHPHYPSGSLPMSCMESPGHLYLLERDMPEHVAGMLRDAV